MANAIFDFTFRIDCISPETELPKNLGQILEGVLKRADPERLKNEVARHSGIPGHATLVTTGSTPLTVRYDIEIDADLLSEMSLAAAQEKLNDIQLTIGEYLAYLLRLELDRKGLGKAVQISFDHGFVHSSGLRWKERSLWWNMLIIGGPAFAMGVVVGVGVLFYLMRS
jgi:hypothetical protein